MLFNSIGFCFFLVTVYTLYWFLFQKNLKLQNLLLLSASYFFYGFWDWRFVFLLCLSTVIDYAFGIAVHNATKRKKLYLWLSVINNVGILAIFKYYDFFAGSFATLFNHLGFSTTPFLLNIALPVGISFYTFHGMSYVFDIYRNKITPTKNFIDYAVFVCFFPLLVAGPIERAWHLLPQIQQQRKFSYRKSVQGIQLMLWGFFKKIVIADSLSPIVHRIFKDNENQPGFFLIVGVIYFSVQIYCDFSGYTDIARGTAKLFGFELLINFRFPYFSRDIAEFWRRWHISLSSWFRDYLYIPLGGSKEGTLKAVRNILIVFLVSGFWHGAHWTFIAWGLLHAIYFLPLLLLKKNREYTGPIAINSFLPSFREGLKMLLTYGLVCFAWIFFRADNITEAFHYIQGIFTHQFYSLQEFDPPMYYLPFIIILFFIIEWLCRNHDIEFFFLKFKSNYSRYAVYFFMLFMIFMFGSFKENTFIYFQF